MLKIEDHHNNTSDQILVKAFITKTKTELHKADPVLHMEFHEYVSYPPENYLAPVYFNTTYAIDVFNHSLRSDDEKKSFNHRMNRYSQLLFETHKQALKYTKNC